MGTTWLPQIRITLALAFVAQTLTHLRNLFLKSPFFFINNILFSFIILHSCRSFYFVSCRFGHDAKIIHFTGAVKPWSASSQSADSLSPIMEHFKSLWWKEYLNYSTSSLTGKKIHQNSEKPQQVRTSRDLTFRCFDRLSPPVSKVKKIKCCHFRLVLKSLH